MRHSVMFLWVRAELQCFIYLNMCVSGNTTQAPAVRWQMCLVWTSFAFYKEWAFSDQVFSAETDLVFSGINKIQLFQFSHSLLENALRPSSIPLVSEEAVFRNCLVCLAQVGWCVCTLWPWRCVADGDPVHSISLCRDESEAAAVCQTTGGGE